MRIHSTQLLELSIAHGGEPRLSELPACDWPMLRTLTLAGMRPRSAQSTTASPPCAASPSATSASAQCLARLGRVCPECRRLTETPGSLMVKPAADGDRAFLARAALSARLGPLLARRDDCYRTAHVNKLQLSVRLGAQRSPRRILPNMK